MVRKRIIVRGNVQGVGYRVLVKRIAQNLGINGIVRNLKDGSVEIYCEASNTVLAKFLKLLKIERKDDSLLSVNVESIKVFGQDTKGYRAGKPPKKFAFLDIDYGKNLTFVEKENLERQELIILGGSQIHQDLEVIRTDLNTLDVKYGRISSSIASIDRNFAELIKVIKNMQKE